MTSKPQSGENFPDIFSSARRIRKVFCPGSLPSQLTPVPTGESSKMYQTWSSAPNFNSPSWPIRSAVGTLGGAGAGVGRSYAGRLCLKLNRSSAVSFSATTVSPLGPWRTSVMLGPMSPDSWNSL